MTEANEYRLIREQKRDALAALGADPYAVRTPPRESVAALKAAFEAMEPAATPENPARIPGRAVAGRVLANRRMGKAVFVDLYDQTGKLQVYLNAKAVGEQGMKVYDNIDLGDFVWFTGDVQRTRTGEVTLFATGIQFLTKALSVPPLPREYKDEQGNVKHASAFTDPELRYRQRYLDLMVHADVRRRFELRSAIVAAIREMLTARGFLEVETPMLHVIPGGARARPFITHHNALHMNMYLRIAPELFLKRLLVGGFERVFEINRSFRNEGIDATHNPEFTMLELYEAYGDYHSMMEITEAMFRHAARAARPDGDLVFRWGDVEIDLGQPFRRVTYTELLRDSAGVDVHDVQAVRAKAAALGIETHDDHYKLADQVLEATAMSRMVQPTFLIDYPTPICPLTKSKPEDPRVAERFELFINGMEFANAFSELNEPVEQLRRFNEQVALGAVTQDVEAPKEVDHDYVNALEAGMPPAGGLGVGIDRLVMLLTDTHSIRDAILFPHMKREHADARAAALQRARIAVQALLEELRSPVLPGHDVLDELRDEFFEVLARMSSTSAGVTANTTPNARGAAPPTSVAHSASTTNFFALATLKAVLDSGDTDEFERLVAENLDEIERVAVLLTYVRAFAPGVEFSPYVMRALNLAELLKSRQLTPET